MHFSILRTHSNYSTSNNSIAKQVTFSNVASQRSYHKTLNSTPKKLSKNKCEIKHPKVSLEALQKLLGQLDLDTKEAVTLETLQPSEIITVETDTEEITNSDVETVSVCVAAGQENDLLNSETNPLDSSECLYDKKSGSMLKYTIATTSIRCERSDTSALIDSCASASLISKRFLEKVLSESQRPIQIKQIQQRLAVNGVGGHDSNPNTYCVLHISLGNRTIQHPFIVHENLPHNLLLGLDFIVPNGGIIDTTNSELRLTKLKITVSITMAQKTSEIRKAEILFAAESVTIEPFSSAVITARAMKNSKIKRGTIKGNIHTYDKIAAKKGIFTAKGSPTLVNGETLILLGNLSKEPIKVSSGTYVSVFSPQEGEET